MAAIDTDLKGSVFTISMLSREGNIINKKDNAFNTTAIDIVIPCARYLRRCLRLRLTKSKIKMTI